MTHLKQNFIHYIIYAGKLPPLDMIFFPIKKVTSAVRKKRFAIIRHLFLYFNNLKKINTMFKE